MIGRRQVPSSPASHAEERNRSAPTDHHSVHVLRERTVRSRWQGSSYIVHCLSCITI